MKKKFLFLVLALVLIPGAIFAEDLSATLIQPGFYNGKKGQTLTYNFDLDLKSGYEKRLKSFNVSLMMDPNLKVQDVQVEGLKKDKNWRLTTSTLDGKNIVNFTVDQVDILEGREKLRLNITTSLKKDMDGKGDLKNTYVLYYMDKTGKEKSDQKDLVTTPSKEKQDLRIDPLKENATILQGQGPAKAKIRIFKGKTLLAEGYASQEGTFEIVMNPQAKGTQLRVEALVQGQEKLTKDLVVQEKVSEEKPQKPSKDLEENLEKLRDLLTYAKAMPIENRPLEEASRLKAMIALGDYLEVKTNLENKELEDLLPRLLESMEAIQPPFMKGTSKTSFAPNKAMTRAEVASVLYQIKGNKGLPYMSSFKDVDQGKWYGEAIGFVEDQGYMQGIGGGRFEPNREITKSEFAAVAAKLFRPTVEKNSWVKRPEMTPAFPDVKRDYWAYEAISSLKDQGIVTGDQKGLYHPEKTMTRSECTIVLLRGMYGESPLVKKYGINPFKDVKESHWAYGAILQATGNDLQQLKK